MNKHIYTQQITWTGNRGEGTVKYDAYDRNFDWEVKGKPLVHCSSDVPFRGDGSKLNPEDMFLASISSCHMLWYLHLCADAGITVVSYKDMPEATMIENPGHGGRFENCVLRPVVEILQKDKIELANALHDEAGKKCFIANSCNFEIRYEPKTV